MTSRMVIILLLQVHLAAALSFYAVRIFETTDAGHWEPVVAGCLLEFICVAIYLKGLARSRGKHALELIVGALGRWWAVLVFLPFICFIVFRLILLVRHQTFDINTVLLPETPYAAISLVYVILSFYAASKGIEGIARVSAGIFFLFFPFVPFSLLISYRNFDFFNIFPLWDATFSFKGSPSFYAGMYAHTGFLFLGFLSASTWTPRIRKTWPVLAFITVLFLAIVYVPLLIFGHESAVILDRPTLIASDTIDLEWVVFDWLPTFYIVAFSAFGFLESAVLVWMLSLLFRRLLVPVNEKWFLIILTLIVFALSLAIPNTQTLNRFDTILSGFVLYSMIMIPTATFLSSYMKRRKSL